MPSVTTDVPVVRSSRVICLEPLMTTGPAGEDESSILFLRFHAAPLFTCNQAVTWVRRSELIGQVRQQQRYLTSFSSCNSKTPNIHIVKPLFGVCGGYTAKPLPLSLSFEYWSWNQTLSGQHLRFVWPEVPISRIQHTCMPDYSFLIFV
jgi:hypothetical protein